MAQHWLEWAGYLDLAAIVGLLANLASNGLYRVYRCFFAYLAADALETILALVFFPGNHRVKTYALFYVAGQSVKLILAIFVVLELYRVALEGHPALAKFGRNTVAYVLLAAAIFAAGGLMLGASLAPGENPLLPRFFSFERTMDAWLMIFLILISVFMTWFPVRLKRNSVLYITGFVVYFLSRSAGLLLIDLEPRSAPAINAAMIAIASLCLLAWLVGLNAEGERTTTVIGHRWDKASIDRLTDQLGEINSRLLRLSRR